MRISGCTIRCLVWSVCLFVVSRIDSSLRLEKGGFSGDTSHPRTTRGKISHPHSSCTLWGYEFLRKERSKIEVVQVDLRRSFVDTPVGIQLSLLLERVSKSSFSKSRLTLWLLLVFISLVSRKKIFKDGKFIVNVVYLFVW